MRNLHECDAIKSLGNRILTLRAQEDYYQTQVLTASGPEDVASPRLIGNLGGISFRHNGKNYGENLIAASAKIKYELEDYLKDEGNSLVVIGASDQGTLLYRISENEFGPPYEPRFRVKKSRTHDSEYILLNALDGFLQGKGISNGKLYLVTERIPCSSCTGVINEFCKIYGDIPISVFYMLLSYKKVKANGVSKLLVRKVEDFYNECVSPQVELSWIAIEGDTLHVGKHSRGQIGPVEWVKGAIDYLK